jgi:type III secretion protein V
MNASIATLQNRLLGLTKYADVLLAVVVVLILSLMILPVPPWLLDLLLATNLSISILLLVLSMYVPNVLAFSTFPSLLLVTTLFRLGLNITTTRLILLEAHAGDIIFTFGNFVVGGNFAVGVVIFLIITIVQFVVITKGAERVAEVAARFTLDAMPGKQMSVDADLRSGNIDQAEAKRRRHDLEKESQLHGAMGWRDEVCEGRRHRRADHHCDQHPGRCHHRRAAEGHGGAQGPGDVFDPDDR